MQVHFDCLCSRPSIQGIVSVLGPSGQEDQNKLVKTHHLAYLGKGILENSAGVLDGLSLKAIGDSGADVILFAGEPIGAPVKAEGTMVMNTDQDLQTANRVSLKESDDKG